MKRVYFYLALLLVLGLAIPAHAGGGNGAPSGAHYNLNIIGVPQDKSADMTDNNGHRIFVMLEGRKTKIMLSEGEYKVLDANGTDGTAAFQLPRPDSDDDGVIEYSVWVRALGKPGENVKAMMGACAYDEEGTEYCENYTMIIRMKGKANKFSNVSADLLYVYADLDGDGTAEQYPLFSDALQDYFWDYDNNGLKLAQFRFYEETE